MSVDQPDTTRDATDLSPGHRLLIETDDADENALAAVESEHVGVLVWTDGDAAPETIEALLADVSADLATLAGDRDE